MTNIMHSSTSIFCLSQIITCCFGTFPPFYNVSSPADSSFDCRPLFGIYKRNENNKTGMRRFPEYTKVNSRGDFGNLYQAINGTFFITDPLYKYGSMRLVGKHSPESDEWECTNLGDTWTGDKLMNLQPLESFLRNTYVVSSNGPALEQYPESFGVYYQSEMNCSGYPIYSKNNVSGQYLLLNTEGNWAVSKHKTCNKDSGVMYQMSYGSPFPKTYFPWNYYTGQNGDFVPDYTMMVYSTDTPEPYTNVKSILSTLFIVIIVTSSVVFITFLLVLFFLYRCFKKRQSARKIETVDDNFYYGDEDYDEEYQESAIVDQNDYYAL
jgi:hypothetical protein